MNKHYEMMYREFDKKVNPDGSATAFFVGTDDVMFHVEKEGNFESTRKSLRTAYGRGYTDGIQCEKTRIRALLGL